MGCRRDELGPGGDGEPPYQSAELSTSPSPKLPSGRSSGKAHQIEMEDVKGGRLGKLASSLVVSTDAVGMGLEVQPSLHRRLGLGPRRLSSMHGLSPYVLLAMPAGREEAHRSSQASSRGLVELDAAFITKKAWDLRSQNAGARGKGRGKIYNHSSKSLALILNNLLLYSLVDTQ